MDLARKLGILADAAKYDASCASSGTTRRNALGAQALGSTDGMGICHSYAPDGRCISLLKVLLTNFCIYDCVYCVNRLSSNVPRARFSVREIVQLTIDFYKRNYIEGLFLSSGIIRSPDYTMEQVVNVARVLREEHAFRGYIHLKTIPDASPELLQAAGRYADRLSINVELPTPEGLQRLAPEKDATRIRTTMHRVRAGIEENNCGRKTRSRPPPFAPAGQSTQMIVGADASDDRTIIASSASLYSTYRLKRVYYSAFSPIPDASSKLPLKAPPLVREHRLYQADWLMRFYSFDASEIVAAGDGMLDLDIDPKLAWALRNRERFPIDVNRAEREMLLRIPGFGVSTVRKIIAERQVRSITSDDLVRLRVPFRKAAPFIITADRHSAGDLDRQSLRATLRTAEQLSLFGAPDHANAADTP